LTLEVIKADSFFRILKQCSIRDTEEPHSNLQEALQLSKDKNPELIVLKALKNIVET